MFTGIVEGLGTILKILPQKMGSRLTIQSDFKLTPLNIGDSIAVNGACLTATAIDSKGFYFDADLSPETIALTNFSIAKSGDRVNIERALRLSDRINGHLVSGHIDGIGKIKAKRSMGNAIVISIDAAESIARYIIQKGSVAVDGISLTINSCNQTVFDVSIIPHTAKATTIGYKGVGSFVNIETDIIGKYVEKFVLSGNKEEKTKSIIDMTFLSKTGFM